MVLKLPRSVAATPWRVLAVYYVFVCARACCRARLRSPPQMQLQLQRYLHLPCICTVPVSVPAPAPRVLLAAEYLTPFPFSCLLALLLAIAFLHARSPVESARSDGTYPSRFCLDGLRHCSPSFFSPTTEVLVLQSPSEQTRPSRRSRISCVLKMAAVRCIANIVYERRDLGLGRSWNQAGRKT